MTALILLVDDYEDDRRLEMFILGTLGYSAICTSDGKTALILTQRHQPDLILLDIWLPGLGGLEVVHHLKRQPLTAAIPVIAVTALAMLGDRERILAAGCDDYLQKPCPVEELETTLELHLNQSRTATSASGQRSET